MTGRGRLHRRPRRVTLRAPCPWQALGTILRASDGWPYESLVAVATDHGGASLLLLSDLSERARNRKDDRASLLSRPPAREDPQFREPIAHPETVRAVLVGLANRARDAVGGAA